MLFDFFENLTGDYDIAGMITDFVVVTGIIFLFVIPFLIPVFRNSYFIDKMNKKNKRQNNDFNTQLSKLLGDTEKDIEIEALKAEIERLKRGKK